MIVEDAKSRRPCLPRPRRGCGIRTAETHDRSGRDREVLETACTPDLPTLWGLGVGRSLVEGADLFQRDRSSGS